MDSPRIDACTVKSCATSSGWPLALWASPENEMFISLSSGGELGQAKEQWSTMTFVSSRSRRRAMIRRFETTALPRKRMCRQTPSPARLSMPPVSLKTATPCPGAVCPSTV